MEGENKAYEFDLFRLISRNNFYFIKKGETQKCDRYSEKNQPKDKGVASKPKLSYVVMY